MIHPGPNRLRQHAGAGPLGVDAVTAELAVCEKILKVNEFKIHLGRYFADGGPYAFLHRVWMDTEPGNPHDRENPDRSNQNDSRMGRQGQIGFDDPPVVPPEDIRIPVPGLGIVRPKHQEDDVRIPFQAVLIDSLLDIRRIGIEPGRSVVVSEIADLILLPQLFLKQGRITLLPGIQQRESPGNAVSYAGNADHRSETTTSSRTGCPFFRGKSRS